MESAEGLKKPAVKEPTVPEGFELQIEKRLQERQTKKPQEGEDKQHTFKPQPLPKKILEGVVVSSHPAANTSNTRVYTETGLVFIVLRDCEAFMVLNLVKRISSCQQGLPEKKVIHPTVPESPAFALKKRIHVEPKVEEVRTHMLALKLLSS